MYALFCGIMAKRTDCFRRNTMQKYYHYFPLSDSVHAGDVVSLIISVVIYVVACAVLGVLQAVL